MSARGVRLLGSYHWPQAHRDLEMGIHPEVVACRLGVPIDNILSTADAMGWAVSWKGPSPDTIIDAAERVFK